MSDATLQVNISDEQFTEAIQTAILSKINESTREELIKEAIKHLVTAKAAYASQERRLWTAPLQDLINNQVMEVAKTIVEKELETDDLREKIRALLVEAYEKLMTSDREKVVDTMVRGMRKALTGTEY